MSSSASSSTEEVDHKDNLTFKIKRAGSPKEEAFKSTNGVVGRSLDGKFIEKGGNKKWFLVPREYGGDKRYVTDVIPDHQCQCKKHKTTIYNLEGGILVFYCRTKKAFAWMM